MKLYHLQTAFLVICLLLVCSQGRSSINTDGGIVPYDNDLMITNNDTITNNWDNEDTYNALFGTSGQSVQDTNALISDSNNNIDNFDVNLDPSVPEPTTLSLLAMSLLLVGRRWR